MSNDKIYEDYVRSGILAACRAMPLCATAIRALNPVITRGVPTMAVDKYYRMYANPDFIDEIRQMARDVSNTNKCPVCKGSEHHENAYVAGAICHEAWHLLRKHHSRAIQKTLTTRLDYYVWALAVDMEINDDILDVLSQHNLAKGSSGYVARPCFPPVQLTQDIEHPETKAPGVLVPSSFGCEDGKLAESYFETLKEQLLSQPNMTPDQLEGILGEITDCGSGMDGKPRAYEVGEPHADNPVPGISEVEGRLLSKEVAKDIKNAGRGNTPGGWKRWAEDELEPPRYDWRKELRQVIKYSVSINPGDTIRSYRRLGRRSASLMQNGRITTVLPSSHDPTPRVCVVQDTSGSMGKEEITASLREIRGILQSTKATVGFINCDSAADKPQEVRSVGAISLVGGGGTDMSVGIQAALESTPAPQVIVVITDGYTPWPKAAPYGVRVVVCLVADGAVHNVPQWAHTVRVFDDHKKANTLT